jgi:hypothetical protein
MEETLTELMKIFQLLMAAIHAFAMLEATVVQKLAVWTQRCVFTMVPGTTTRRTFVLWMDAMIANAIKVQSHVDGLNAIE